MRYYQVERGTANKGAEIEIIGFGPTKKTTLTGIGTFSSKQVVQLCLRSIRNVP